MRARAYPLNLTSFLRPFEDFENFWSLGNKTYHLIVHNVEVQRLWATYMQGPQYRAIAYCFPNCQKQLFGNIHPNINDLLEFQNQRQGKHILLRPREVETAIQGLGLMENCMP